MKRTRRLVRLRSYFTMQKLFQGKLVLAPMVRAGELPTRLLSLENHADLVWSPEIIDKKILTTERHFNDKINCIEYRIRNSNKNNVVLKIDQKREVNKLIFQMGTCNTDLAVSAAKLVIKDVAGIDVNSGCPKHFSVHAGMGAALLTNPTLLCDILSGLVEKVGKPNEKPISVKIRLLPKREDTLQLVSKLCDTGITNLTVHFRTREMRNRELPIHDYIRDIYDICLKKNVSMIINGNLRDRQDFLRLREQHELSKDIGGMIAEAAESNPTVFNLDGPIINWWIVASRFLELALETDNHLSNTKFMLARLVPGKVPIFKMLAQCKQYEHIQTILGMIDRETGELKGDANEYMESIKQAPKNTKNNNKVNDTIKNENTVPSNDKKRRNDEELDTTSGKKLANIVLERSPIDKEVI